MRGYFLREIKLNLILKEAKQLLFRALAAFSSDEALFVFCCHMKDSQNAFEYEKLFDSAAQEKLHRLGAIEPSHAVVLETRVPNRRLNDAQTPSFCQFENSAFRFFAVGAQTESTWKKLPGTKSISHHCQSPHGRRWRSTSNTSQASTHI